MEEKRQEGRQEGFDLEPDYLKDRGIAFEIAASGLYVPAPGEHERLEAERPKELPPICIAEEKPDIVNPLLKFGFNRTKTARVDPMTMLKFLAKGKKL